MPDASRCLDTGLRRTASGRRSMRRSACFFAVLAWTPLSHAQDFSATIYGNLIAYLEVASSYGATVDATRVAVACLPSNHVRLRNSTRIYDP